MSGIIVLYIALTNFNCQESRYKQIYFGYQIRNIVIKTTAFYKDILLC